MTVDFGYTFPNRNHLHKKEKIKLQVDFVVVGKISDSQSQSIGSIQTAPIYLRISIDSAVSKLNFKSSDIF